MRAKVCPTPASVGNNGVLRNMAVLATIKIILLYQRYKQKIPQPLPLALNYVFNNQPNSMSQRLSFTGE